MLGQLRQLHEGCGNGASSAGIHLPDIGFAGFVVEIGWRGSMRQLASFFVLLIDSAQW